MGSRGSRGSMGSRVVEEVEIGVVGGSKALHCSLKRWKPGDNLEGISFFFFGGIRVLQGFRFIGCSSGSRGVGF